MEEFVRNTKVTNATESIPVPAIPTYVAHLCWNRIHMPQLRYSGGRDELQLTEIPCDLVNSS
jgi:hypothetical protein